jgi:hypothetical protein
MVAVAELKKSFFAELDKVENREVLEKLLKVSQKALTVESKNPWKIVAEFNSHLSTASARQREILQKSNWRCLSDKVRTFFDQNPG